MEYDLKHKDLIKELKTLGFYLLRHGSDHDIYSNGSIELPIPRHKEINELLSKTILKKAKQ